jgi:hypothetical protein
MRIGDMDEAIWSISKESNSHSSKKKKKKVFHLHNYLLFSVPVYIISKTMGILGVKRFVLGEIHDIIIL